MNMNAKKFNSSVVPSLLAAAGGTVLNLRDSRRTSLSRDGKMMVGAGAVAIQRAGTPAERQHVVCLVNKHWVRVGQRPRQHLLVWDTADGAAPADALLEDTEQAYEQLPWFHKAAIGNGAPCSYYSVVRDVGDLELEEIGGMVVDESSDAVWIVELIGTDKRCGLAAMRALYELAFAGRSEMRAIVLHAVRTRYHLYPAGMRSRQAPWERHYTRHATES